MAASRGQSKILRHDAKEQLLLFLVGYRGLADLADLLLGAINFLLIEQLDAFALAHGALTAATGREFRYSFTAMGFGHIRSSPYSAVLAVADFLVLGIFALGSAFGSDFFAFGSAFFGLSASFFLSALDASSSL